MKFIEVYFNDHKKKRLGLTSELYMLIMKTPRRPRVTAFTLKGIEKSGSGIWTSIAALSMDYQGSFALMTASSSAVLKCSRYKIGMCIMLKPR